MDGEKISERKNRRFCREMVNVFICIRNKLVVSERKREGNKEL